MAIDKILDDKLEELFNELVPGSGSAETLAGEVVRAAMRVNYRWYNDGDKVGRFDRNGGDIDRPYQFLLNTVGGNLPSVSSIVEESYDSDDSYEAIINLMLKTVIDWIDAHPEAKTTKNTVDMFDTELEDEFDTCDECGMTFDEGEGCSNIGSDNSDLWDKTLEHLYDDYNTFNEFIDSYYGSYYITNEEIESAVSDLFGEWYRQHFDYECLCNDCIDQEASSAADYINDNFDEFDDEGYSRLTGRDEDGFDRDGYDAEGFNTENIDREGYDRDGYDSEGLDRKGLNRQRQMGSNKALKNFLGASTDEDLHHDADYYRRR